MEDRIQILGTWIWDFTTYRMEHLKMTIKKKLFLKQIPQINGHYDKNEV